MPLNSPFLHANLTDVTSDQHHARSHDHSSASDGVTLSLGGGLNLNSVITPTALAADANDYNPSGKDTAFLWRLDAGGAARNITGFVAPAVTGALHWVCNLDNSFNITLVHNSGSSAANNRIIGVSNSNVVIGGGDAVVLLYDPTSLRWRVLAAV